MAKRFLKQPASAERDEAGCLSGFISIFDFRVGHYFQKFFSDRKHGVNRGLVVFHVQPQQTDFQDHDGSTVVLTSSDFEGRCMTCFNEEVIYGFVTTLLQESGMSCYEILEGWDPSDQLLDPSLSEAEILHSLPADPKLLCDCKNEVLVETQKRLFECSPGSIKPANQVILRGLDLIEEVCRGIHRHLQLSQFTLDHIVTKDIMVDVGWTIRLKSKPLL